MIGMSLSMASNPSQVTVIQQAIAVLRKFGSDAHVYLPGVGMLNGLTAGNYIDSAGTTAGVVDQPVGLALDAMGSLGVELVTNGDFSNGTAGWTLGNVGVSTAGIAGGVCTLTKNDVNDTYISNTASVISGKSYVVELDIVSITASKNIGFRFGSAGVAYPLSSPTAGRISVILVAGASGVFSIYTGGGLPLSIVIDNISVREVTGIAASQPTTSAKPILRRGAVNLLTYSQGLSTVNYTASGATVTQDALAPDGTLTAHTLTVTAFSSLRPASDVVVVPGTTYTYAFTAKRGTATDFKLSFYNFTAGSDILAATSVYAEIGTDWTTVVRTLTVPAGCTALRIFVSRDPGVTGTTFIHRAALFQGTYTAAQIQALGGIPLTTTAPASTALGPQYWSFDGSNDSLSLGGPLFQQSDDHFVCAGFSTLAANGVFSGAGRAVEPYPEVAGLVNSAGVVTARWRDDANLTVAVQYATPSGQVVIAACGKDGATRGLWLNGASVGSSATALGATTVNAAAIGSYASGGNFCVGGIYPIVAVKGATSAAEKVLLTKFVGQLSGVQI